jgi:hypothetical protein
VGLEVNLKGVSGGDVMRQRKSQIEGSAKDRPVSLDEHLEKRLASYALAAVAAGVSVLACSPQAEAKIVYTNMWIPITQTTNLDLNGDGVVDFVISNHRTNSCTNHVCSLGTIKVSPQGSGNAVWGTNSYAAALLSGVTVGSKGRFQPGHEFMANETHHTSTEGSNYGSRGPWKQITNHYLGVKFVIQGEVHYGWVRVDVTATLAGMYGAISGYAYETVPNKSILTGQKSGAVKQRNSAMHGSASVDAPAPTQGSLGVLALGVPGLQK